MQMHDIRHAKGASGGRDDELTEGAAVTRHIDVDQVEAAVEPTCDHPGEEAQRIEWGEKHRAGPARRDEAHVDAETGLPLELGAQRGHQAIDAALARRASRRCYEDMKSAGSGAGALEHMKALAPRDARARKAAR